MRRRIRRGIGRFRQRGRIAFGFASVPVRLQRNRDWQRQRICGQADYRIGNTYRNYAASRHRAFRPLAEPGDPILRRVVIQAFKDFHISLNPSIYPWFPVRLDDASRQVADRAATRRGEGNHC